MTDNFPFTEAELKLNAEHDRLRRALAKGHYADGMAEHEALRRLLADSAAAAARRARRVPPPKED